MKNAKKATPSPKHSKSPGKTAKAEKKAGKAGDPEAIDPALAGPSAEELEDAEDAANETAARAATGGGPPQEVSITFKNFRHHPDMENFYRFIYENDLRFEALDLITKRLGEGKSKEALVAASPAAPKAPKAKAAKVPVGVAASSSAEKKKQKSASRATR
jgi:hypothetical protein